MMYGQVQLKCVEIAPMKIVFFCEKLEFVFNEFIKADVHKWKLPNNLWKVYLNLNEHRFKKEHDIGN